VNLGGSANGSVPAMLAGQLPEDAA